MRKLIASLCASSLLALGIVGTATAQQEADGLVVVQIDNVLNNNDVNVVVPVQAAVGIAANVCNVVVNAAVLGGIDAGDSPLIADCDSRSPAFNQLDGLTISNN